AFGVRLHPNASAVLLHYFLADSQSDAVARIFLARVQALENNKNLLSMFSRNANSVIFDRNLTVIVHLLCGNLDHGRLALAELDRIPDQVLKQLYQLEVAAMYKRELSARNDYPTVPYRCSKVSQRFVHCRVAVSSCMFSTVAAYARKGQQVFDERLHAQRSLHRIADVPVSLLIQLAAVSFGEQLRVCGHHPQGLLQIV